jgi:hypothetical protein
MEQKIQQCIDKVQELARQNDLPASFEQDVRDYLTSLTRSNG